MARPGSHALTPPPRAARRAIALLSALVLLVHVVLLLALDRLWPTPSALQPLVPPMLTRQIRPAEPVARPPPPVARAAPTRPAVAFVETPAPPPAEGAASTPTPPDLAPLPEPPPAPSQPNRKPHPGAGNHHRPARRGRPLAPNTRLTYRLTGYYRGELTGEARVAWQRDGDRYQTQVDMTVGLLVRMTLTSQGDITPEGLAPREYEEQLGTRRRAVRLGRESITLANGTQRPRPAGVQDTASQFVALTQRFATSQAALVPGESVKFWMARPGGVDAWDYRVVAQEPLYLPLLGQVSTFHLKPEPLQTPRGSIVAEMWFAPSLQHLPVRIRISFNEDSYVDLLVNTIEQR